MQLFRYISGVNSKQKELHMTTPVTNAHKPHDNSLEDNALCFWLGSDNQSADVPEPIAHNVHIVRKRAVKVYVHTFGGYALSYNNFHEPYLRLKALLLEQGKAIEQNN